MTCCKDCLQPLEGLTPCRVCEQIRRDHDMILTDKGKMVEMRQGYYIGKDKTLQGEIAMLKLYNGNEVEAQFDDRSVGRFAYHWHEFPYSLTYNLSRGHMCPKNIANRLGANADRNTHTTLNACPQWQWHNNGIWKDMERLTENWADEWGKLWVICGPIFLDRQPRLWLGEEGEKLIAIPDAFYKIIISDSLPMAEPQVQAFIYPHAIRPSDNHKEYNHRKFLVSVDDIEKRTGLNFFTVLSEDEQAIIESQPAWDVWDDPGSYYLP